MRGVAHVGAHVAEQHERRVLGAPDDAVRVLHVRRQAEVDRLQRRVDQRLQRDVTMTSPCARVHDR